MRLGLGLGLGRRRGASGESVYSGIGAFALSIATVALSPLDGVGTFSLVIAATKSSLTAATSWGQPSTSAITLGGTPRATGTSPPVVTFAAVPTTGSLSFGAGLAPQIRVKISDVTGGTAVGQAKFDISYDDGATWAHTGVTTATTYDADGAATGVRIGFPAGTYGTTQEWRGTVASLTDYTGFVWANATASQQPVLCKVSGKLGLEFFGAQALYCTHATPCGLFAGSNAFSLGLRIKNASNDADGVFFSSASSASSGGHKIRFTQSTTGTPGRFACALADSAGASDSYTRPVSDTGNTDQTVFWIRDGAGLVKIHVNGATDTGDTVLPPNGTLTPNRACLGVNGDSSPDTFYSGVIYEWALFGVALSTTERNAWEAELALT